MRGLGGLVAVLMLLSATAGCSSGAGGGEALPTTTTNVETASSQPPATTTDRTASPPAAIDDRSSEGAIAFARFWFHLVNEAYESGDVAAVEDRSDRGCETCESVIDQIRDVYTSGGHFEGGQITVTSAQASPVDENNSSLVTVGYSQAPLKQLAADGSVVNPGAADTGVAAFYALFRDGQWLAVGITDR